MKNVARRLLRQFGNIQPFKLLLTAFFASAFFVGLATIVQDFQNRVLQNEWNKFRSSVLSRHVERQEHVKTIAHQLEQQRQMQSAEMSRIHAAQDASLDELRAKFADEAIALEYDVARLSEKYLGGGKTTTIGGKNKQLPPAKDKESLPCLGERAHLIDCQNMYKLGSRSCNHYIEALEKCVSQRIVGASSAGKVTAKQ